MHRSVDMAARLAVILVFFLLWGILYGSINAFNAQPGRAVYLYPRPIDVFPGILQTWTAVPYVILGLLMPLLPFAVHWSWRGIRRVLGVYAVTSAIAFAIYLAWPLAMRRPAYDGPGIGAWLMRNVVAVDDPANCLPSLHVAFAVLAALFAQEAGDHRALIVLVWVASLAVMATTITTGQHYFIDLPAGVVVGLVSCYAVRWATRDRRGLSSLQSPRD